MSKKMSDYNKMAPYYNNFTNAISNDTYDMIYDILVDIMEGMAANETYLICSIKFK